MILPKTFRVLSALLLLWVGLSSSAALPVTDTSDTNLSPRQSGGGWCFPFCNPFSGPVNRPGHFNFDVPLFNGNSRWVDVPSSGISVRAETLNTGVVLVSVGLQANYHVPPNAEINIDLRHGRSRIIQLSRSALDVGSESAFARIPASDVQGFVRAARRGDGSFTLQLRWHLGQDL
jgi:hypothetical protein